MKLIVGVLTCDYSEMRKLIMNDQRSWFDFIPVSCEEDGNRKFPDAHNVWAFLYMKSILWRM
jgi:hypothetical protein